MSSRSRAVEFGAAWDGDRELVGQFNGMLLGQADLRQLELGENGEGNRLGHALDRAGKERIPRRDMAQPAGAMR